jgi:dTDP-4-dehydrorhamnose reductase
MYHLAGAAKISRYDFALQLAEVFDLEAGNILPARMCDLKWETKRPRDSTLDTSKARNALPDKSFTLSESCRSLRKGLGIRKEL